VGDWLAPSIRQQTFGHLDLARLGVDLVRAHVVLLIGLVILVLVVAGMFLAGPG
jgi:hypothetical protein